MIKKINLRLFDTVTQTTLLEALSDENKTYYEKRLLDNAEPKLVHDQFADKYKIPSGGGKTIEFRKYSSLPKALTPLTEGVTPDGQNLEVTAITAQVHQYGGWIRLSDYLELTAIDNNVLQATKLLGSQAGRTGDTITREVLAGGTNVMYAPKSSGAAVTSRAGLDATCALTPDLFFRAAAQLEAQNADVIEDSYVAIIHPYAAYDIISSDQFIDITKYMAAEKLFNGELGKIGNVRFVKSTEAKIWKDSTCPTGLAVFGTVVLGAHAYAVTEIEGGGLEHIVKQKGSAGTADPLNQRSSVGWKLAKAAKRLSENYMVRIESCGAYSAKASSN